MMKLKLYEDTVKRLARCGIKDPTSQIIALAEEIEEYRANIYGLEAKLEKFHNHSRTDGNPENDLDAINIQCTNQIEDLIVERDALRREVERLAGQLEFMTDMHSKAVERVNKVTFAKLKLENQLALLQSMIGTALAQFQVDTEA